MPNHEVTSKYTVGVDVGDRYSHLCVLDTETGDVVEEARISTAPTAFERRFSSVGPMRVAVEAGNQSLWISGILEGCGHEVLVANARKLRLIYADGRKSDRLDAENLARIARLDPRLLSPIEHRGEAAQAHLSLLRSREMVVRTRTKLVNHVRGAVKPFGVRFARCSPEIFPVRVRELLPDALVLALSPILETISSLTERIRAYDRELESLSQETYPETALLRQVQGVGPLTALAFVLTVGDPSRFGASREVGAYLGLVPGRHQSGDSDPQQRVSKAGDAMTRRLLVSCAHYVMGPFAQDSDLRRHGEKIAERGGQNARNRAIVAVARKIAVLLHRLWTTGEAYEPLYNANRAAA